MPVSLFDSLSLTLRPLAPSDGHSFRMYCCGPTVYGPAHIGNFRTFVIQDTLRRVLETDGLQVRHVRNLTDVDDKTLRQAQSENVPLATVTRRWTERFHADCAALNLLPPHLEPAATAHIADQVALIEALLERGHAYVSPDGSVYFRVSSFSGYGRLSRLAERELRPGGEPAGPVDADEYERESGGDFALWKAWKPDDGEVRWPGPRGAAPGRPGWHIECSAMSRRHLGDELDLHGGGVDLKFPHHENEIAQSECGTGHHPFCRHWFHSEHLLVEGRKMSKSLGNLHTLDDILARGYSPMELRYALLAGHYRKSLNFTFHGLDSARSALKSLRKLAARLAGSPEALQPLARPQPAAPWGRFAGAWAALCDDLNVPAALGEIFGHAHDLTPEQSHEDATALGRLVFALGLEPAFAPASAPAPKPPAAVIALAEQRWAAKQARDFATADRLRAEIAALGWTMLDSKTAYRLEPARS
jgi:cysteinyl-tRNA synthetase